MTKCNKFDFGWGSAPDPTGGAYSGPQAFWLDLTGTASKEREGKRREGKGRNAREGKRREGERERDRSSSNGPILGPRIFNTLFLLHSPAPRPASPKLRRPTAPSPSLGLQP